jgi:hypothetical protein
VATQVQKTLAKKLCGLFLCFNLQIVLDAERTGDTLRLDIDHIAIEFVRHDAFQPNVSVLNDDVVNRRYRRKSVAVTNSGSGGELRESARLRVGPCS